MAYYMQVDGFIIVDKIRKCIVQDKVYSTRVRAQRVIDESITKGKVNYIVVPLPAPLIEELLSKELLDEMVPRVPKQ